MTVYFCHLLDRHAALSALRRVETQRARLAVLLLFALVILLRQPMFLLSPRFWAEEGTVYFKQAFEHGTLDTLLFCHSGYYDLVKNAGPWLASRLVPLPMAPLVTTLIAFGVQLVPYGIILWSRAEYWNAAWKKILGLLVVLFAPLSCEMWLTSLESNFHLSLVVVLLLAEDVSRFSRRQKWAHRGLMAVATLSSPVPAFATGLFVLKYLATREREVLWQGALLLAGAVLQLVVLLHQPDALYTRQQQAPLYVYPLVAFSRTVMLPLGGLPLAQWLALYQLQPLLDVGSRVLPLLGLTAFVLTGGLLIGLACGLDRRRLIGLLGAWVLFLVLSCLTACDVKDDLIYPNVGGRYFYASNVLFGLLLVERVTGPLERDQRVRRAALVLLTLFLVQGAWAFRVTYHDPQWKSWRSGIEAWTQDHRHSIQLAPGHWHVNLMPVRPHACKDPTCTNGVVEIR